MILQNLAYTAVLLGVLVFVHEFGHFIVAKGLGVKVLRFSIGFGPRVFGFTRGETEYRIAWVPLGGYVKMAGEQPGEDLPPEEAKRGFLAQPPWKRALIVFAGPFFNLVFPILVFFFVSVGSHQAISTRVGTVEPGLPAAKAGILPGDRIVAVDGQPVHTFKDVQEALQPAASRETSLTLVRDGKTFKTHLVPATSRESNPVETVTRGMIGILSVSQAPVIGVLPGSPAEQAGLKTFDRILSVNGRPVNTEEAFTHAVEASPSPVQLTIERDVKLSAPGANLVAPKVLSLSVPKQPGEGYAAIGAQPSDLFVAAVQPDSSAAKAGILPGDRVVSMDGTPMGSTLALSLVLQKQDAKPFTLSWEHAGQIRSATLVQEHVKVTDDLGNEIDQLETGLHFHQPDASEVGEPEWVTVHVGIAQAFWRALKVVPQMTGEMAKALALVITGNVPFKSMGGPVMLYQLASRSAQAGLDNFLNMMALISINLGLVNLVPIPVLDGFHLIAAAWEGIRRRPIPVRAREIANMIGLAMLIVLMVLVFKNDLARITR